MSPIITLIWEQVLSLRRSVSLRYRCASTRVACCVLFGEKKKFSSRPAAVTDVSQGRTRYCPVVLIEALATVDSNGCPGDEASSW